MIFSLFLRMESYRVREKEGLWDREAGFAMAALPEPLTLLHRLSVRPSTMSSRKEKSATLYMWISSGSEAMDLNSLSSAFLTPKQRTFSFQFFLLCRSETQPIMHSHSFETYFPMNTVKHVKYWSIPKFITETRRKNIYYCLLTASNRVSQAACQPEDTGNLHSIYKQWQLKATREH